MLRFSRPPKLLRSLFPSILWNGKPGKIYLTFDDGPDPIRTIQILSCLKDFQAPATFFTLGIKANKYLQVIERIAHDDQDIGVHAFTHRRLLLSTQKKFNEEIIYTCDLLRSVTGRSPLFFRPPFGIFSPWMPAWTVNLQMRLVLWTFLTYDFSFKNADQLVWYVDRHIQSGDILVFHDGHRNSDITIQALPGILESIQKKHFLFGKLTDLV